MYVNMARPPATRMLRMSLARWADDRAAGSGAEPPELLMPPADVPGRLVGVSGSSFLGPDVPEEADAPMPGLSPSPQPASRRRRRRRSERDGGMSSESSTPDWARGRDRSEAP